VPAQPAANERPPYPSQAIWRQVTPRGSLSDIAPAATAFRRRHLFEQPTRVGRTGDGSCRSLGLRCVQQKGAPAGCVRRARLPVPLRAIGEGEAQLTVTRPSQSISPFAPPAFAGLRATTKRSDFCMGVSWSSLPPSGLPLARTHADLPG
jgi:hypothetical protein